MLISGIQKFTVLDYPEKTACIVFTAGCNFRCGYCHNPEFVLPEKIRELRGGFIPEQAIVNFLNERRGLLDGVVITGGEPTMMPDLLDFMGRVKALGFLVKLDTNGNRPEIIKQAIERQVVDYVAMDVKTSLAEYPNLVGKWARPEKIKESLDLLKQGSVDYEFRSTLIKETHSDIILQTMTTELRGAKRLFLQSFRPGITLDPQFKNYHSFSAVEMNSWADKFGATVATVTVRN